MDSLSLYQVVEIVDRYETDCIPVANRTNKVAFIQSNARKTCTRQITVSSICITVFIRKRLNLTPEMKWIKLYSVWFLPFRWQSIWSGLSMCTINSIISTRIIAGIYITFHSHVFCLNVITWWNYIWKFSNVGDTLDISIYIFCLLWVMTIIFKHHKRLPFTVASIASSPVIRSPISLIFWHWAGINFPT